MTPMDDNELRRLLTEYQEAYRQEWEAQKPSADDDGPTLRRKAKELFIDKLPIAAARIVNLAEHGSSEQVSLNAAKFIFEYLGGKYDSSSEDPIADFIASLKNKDAEKTNVE